MIFSYPSVRAWRLGELAGWERELSSALAMSALGVVSYGGSPIADRIAQCQRKVKQLQKQTSRGGREHR